MASERKPAGSLEEARENFVMDKFPLLSSGIPATNYQESKQLSIYPMKNLAS